ncbi:MAG: type III-B CRISPR-associated protein Cas10/Cmr2 [Acidobacteriota bacterium]
MSVDWEGVLLAYLHDPPDKALAIRGHERRACRYLSAALGREVQREELHGTEDQLASIAERLPMPTGRGAEGQVVGPEDGRLTVFHPLSGVSRTLEVDVSSQPDIESAIREIVAPYSASRERFHALWRLLPPSLAERAPALDLLPADTRVPDHTIWHHLDITAGLKAALDGRHGAAFLSFTLGPVQEFIESSQSVRDLWSGSMILSWLTFQGMLPVIEQFGPTAIVYPALRGNPSLDLWLQKELSLKVALPPADSRKAPCLPNRFLAVVPWDGKSAEGGSLARACEERARTAWRDLAGRVRNRLGALLTDQGEASADWDARWDRQIGDYFEFRTAVLPLRQCDDEALVRLAGAERFDDAFPELASVRRLAEAIPQAERPQYEQASAGRWQCQVDLSARLMEAQRLVRHVPASSPAELVPPKCSLMGSFEQMGPEGLEESSEFWERAGRVLRIGGVRLRRQERLCAVALANRFSGPAYLAEALGMEPGQLRFPDAATVAAAEWLHTASSRGFRLAPDDIRRKHGTWRGQWLHQPVPEGDDEEPAPAEVWLIRKKLQHQA